MKPLLVAYASAGNGHRSAAKALGDALEKENTPHFLADVLNFSDPLFRGVYSNLYEILGEHAHGPCKAMYRLTDRSRRESRFLRFIDALSKRKVLPFRSFVRDNEPSGAICTHFLPQLVLLAMREQGHFRGPIYTCITDFDLHRMWYCAGTDGYFVASRRVFSKLLALGAPRDRIFITGIPVAERFAGPVPTQPARNRMKFLFLASSVPDAKVEEILRIILSSNLSMDLRVVAGRNWTLKKKLLHSPMADDLRVEIFGYVNDMEAHMKWADLILTKPGGLTASEALCVGTPMLLISPIPFQETYNAQYLQEEGAGLLCETPESVLQQTRRLMSQPLELEEMTQKANQLGNPRAAMEIIRTVLHEEKIIGASARITPMTGKKRAV